MPLALLVLPRYKEWFKAGYNIAAKNDELDSWINGYMLALLLAFERNKLQGLPRNLYYRNGLLDFDVINIPHCVPRHRAAHSFNTNQPSTPVPPNVRALLTSPLTRRVNVPLYATLCLSYSRSICLACFNISNGKLHNVPRRFLANCHPLAIDRVRQFYPSVENPGTQDLFTHLQRQAFAGLFGFTLPLGYEQVIKRWMDAPANLRVKGYQSVPAVTPCLGCAHKLLRLLPKVPIESGIFDRTLIACLARCFLQTGRNQLVTNIAAS
jgi:hypothetical protein